MKNETFHVTETEIISFPMIVQRPKMTRKDTKLFSAEFGDQWVGILLQMTSMFSSRFVVEFADMNILSN